MLRPEVRNAVERSLADQKQLRRLDPAGEAQYRARFDELRRLEARLDVLTMSREVVLRRLEVTLVGAFAVTLAGATLLWTMRQRRNEARRRREYLDRLTAWQEASRRHAHEIKTPLTAARLEVERLTGSESPDDIRRISESVVEELNRISRFTKEFSSFAVIGQPVLRSERLEKVTAEFCAMFESAWPNVRLQPPAANGSFLVEADRDLVRQVLVNLCTNSAHAGADRVAFELSRDGDRVYLDVRDSGNGVPESIRPRIFEPYVTTRKIGDGMGLGLAISRKILLDHGGDVELLDSSHAGTTFRLTFMSGKD
jgi:nitrogen fixation/metabolism regulation signal transduction histidine kinase